MPNLAVADSQGIGGTGCDFISRRKRRREASRQMTGGSTGRDPASLLARLKTARAVDQKEERRGSQHVIELARRQARQKAIDAATAAYKNALRNEGTRGKACEAALHAYLEICPDDTDVSDQVVKAIINATVEAPSKR